MIVKSEMPPLLTKTISDLESKSKAIFPPTSEVAINMRRAADFLRALWTDNVRLTAGMMEVEDKIKEILDGHETELARYMALK